MSSSSVVFYMLDGHVVENDDDGGHCVLLYGRTKEGRSVTIQVRGFRPFVYMSPYQARQFDQAQKCTGAVWKTTERRTRAYGYHPMAEPFIKVEFSSMKEYRRHGYKKFMYDRRNIMLLFLYVTKTNMSSWVTVGCAKPLLDSTSTSQDMYTAYIDCVRPLTTNVPRQLPPIMVCSFDIETFSPTGSFPQSCVVDNPIICIGLVFGAYPFDTMRKVVLTTKASTPLDDVEIVVCASESIMLDTFATLTEDTDVFTGYNIVGFDYQYLCDRAMRLGSVMQREFVFKQQKSPERWRQCRAKYQRAVDEHVNMDRLDPAVRLLGVYETFEVAHAAADGFARYTPVNTFFQQDRQRRVLCPYVTKYTDTAAKGQSTIHRLQRNGKVDFDMLPYIRNSMKLLNYKLDTVSGAVLGDQKVDLSIPEMFRKWEAGDPESVSGVLNYCVIDCVLPLTLMKKLNGLENQTEMSCVTSTNLDDVINGGQQIKSYNLLRRYCLEHGYLMDEPTISRPEDLKGATVLPPQFGFYKTPIATLDFASLYPSIIRARNLCYTTLVLDPQIKAQLSPKDTYVVDTGSETFTYVKPHKRKGILPEILGSLLDQRKQAKKDMKNAKDPLEKSVQNGRQLALKVTANSLYGFTGVGKGYFPCYPIAISVTATGRRMIQECKLITKQHFPNAKCVYGDTDSIMVQFQGCINSQEGLERCFEHGERLATIITEYFQKMTETPYIILEFEKACWPQLFFAVKKRYLSRYYESKDGPAKLDAKGVQLVRTDGSKLLRDVYRDIVHAIIPLDGLPAKDPQQIGGEIEGILTSHLQKMRQRPIEDFVIAKTLKTEYKNGGHNIAQVWLWKQLLKRIDMGEITMQPPRSGDKMPYVIMFNKDKKKKVFEKVEHPEYAEFLNLDFAYYIESLRKPLEQLCELFTSNVPGILNTFLCTESRRRNRLQDISSFFSSTPLALDRVTTEERPPWQPAPTIKAKNQTGKKKSSIFTFFSKVPEPPVQKRKQAPTMTNAKSKADTNKKSKPCSGV